MTASASSPTVSTELKSQPTGPILTVRPLPEAGGQLDAQQAAKDHWCDDEQSVNATPERQGHKAVEGAWVDPVDGRAVDPEPGHLEDRDEHDGE